MPEGSKIAIDDEASGSAGDDSEEEGDGDSAMSGEGDDEAGSKAGSEVGDEGGDGDADASDAEGGAWDEEDEMDDAFRRERLHDMTQDGSGSDAEGDSHNASCPSHPSPTPSPLNITYTSQDIQKYTDYLTKYLSGQG